MAVRTPFCAGALLVGLLAAAELGCSAGPAATSRESEARSERLPKSSGRCLLTRTITGWRVIGRNQIVVDTRPPQVIHVFGTCHRLRDVEELGFSSRDGQICDYRSDALIAGDQRCPITAIVPYEDKQIREQDEELERQERDQQGADDAEEP
jgi:hypothetical protein